MSKRYSQSNKRSRLINLNMRNPTVGAQYRKKILDSLISNLYLEQSKYWVTRLQDLLTINRPTTGHYCVVWKNKIYDPFILPTSDPGEQIAKHTVLPFNTKIPEHVSELNIITSEIDEIVDEIYDTKRFISNLLLFDMPPVIFQKVLGNRLFEIVSSHITEWYGDTELVFNKNQLVSVNTFVDAHSDILHKMKERLILNLVT